MTSNRYYISTVADWRRHSARLANSHWFALNSAQTNGSAPAPSATPGPADPAEPILILIEADEGAHLALEDDPAFQPLPHPLAQKPISDRAQESLAALAIAPGATTFDIAEAAARFHPLLRHRVF